MCQTTEPDIYSSISMHQINFRERQPLNVRLHSNEILPCVEIFATCFSNIHTPQETTADYALNISIDIVKRKMHFISFASENKVQIYTVKSSHPHSSLLISNDNN